MEYKTRDLTCIVCPRGCALHVALTDGHVTDVNGYTCPRGRRYAIDECTHPVRTLTSTVRTSDGGVVPVKTSTAIPKELLFAAMEALGGMTVTLPVHIGDVIIRDLLHTGADVVATDERV